jgi:hypothetical protein
MCKSHLQEAAQHWHLAVGEHALRACLPSRPPAARRRRVLATTEGRLAHAELRGGEQEAELAAAREQLQGAAGALAALEGEHEALREEYRAMSEDLEALVRENQVRWCWCGCWCWLARWPAGARVLRRLVLGWENPRSAGGGAGLTGRVLGQQQGLEGGDPLPRRAAQVVSSELGAAAEQRDATAAELRRTQLVLGASEQQVRARGAELEDVRHAYEQLATEHRRAAAAAAQLEREAAGREGALRSRVDEVAALQEAQRAAQATVNQYIVDVQVRACEGVCWGGKGLLLELQRLELLLLETCSVTQLLQPAAAAAAAAPRRRWSARRTT